MTPSADPPASDPSLKMPVPGAAAAARPSNAGAPTAAPQQDAERAAGAAAAGVSKRKRAVGRLADRPSETDFEAQIVQRLSQLEQQLRQELAGERQQWQQELATVNQQLAMFTQMLAVSERQHAALQQQHAALMQQVAVSQQQQAALLEGLRFVAAHAGFELPADLQQLDPATGPAGEQTQEELGALQAVLPEAGLAQPRAATQRDPSQTTAGAHHQLWTCTDPARREANPSVTVCLCKLRHEAVRSTENCFCGSPGSGGAPKPAPHPTQPPERQAGRRVPAPQPRRRPAQQAQQQAQQAQRRQSLYTMPSPEELERRQQQYHEEQERRKNDLRREVERAAMLRDEAEALGITLVPPPGREWSGMVGGSTIPIGSREEMNAPFAFLKGHMEEVW